MLNYKGYTAMRQGREWFIYYSTNLVQYVAWMAGGTQREVKHTIDGLKNREGQANV